MQTNAGRGNRARFATTRWSLVLAVSNGADETSDGALATLCELYWFPIYAFIRRSGRSADAAADLTQGFFTAVVEKGYFGQANRDRGRFRSFLRERFLSGVLIGGYRNQAATAYGTATTFADSYVWTLPLSELPTKPAFSRSAPAADRTKIRRTRCRSIASRTFRTPWERTGGGLQAGIPRALRTTSCPATARSPSAR